MEDESGCSSEAAISVSVKEEARSVYIPNVFSPNGDGFNDVFTVFGGKAVEEIRLLRVFNRWGGLVYEGKEFTPGTTGWNGDFHEKPMNPGVFVYLAEVLWADGEVELLSGDVTLVR